MLQTRRDQANSGKSVLDTHVALKRLQDKPQALTGCTSLVARWAAAPVVHDSKVRQQLGLSIRSLWVHGSLLITRMYLAPAKDLAAGGLKELDATTQANLQNGFQDIDDTLQELHSAQAVFMSMLDWRVSL